MAVTKVNGFAAPYRSLTFRQEKDELAGGNGLLSMSGPITVSGSNLLIPPYSFIQQGLIVKSDAVQPVPLNTTLPAPYFLTVTSPSVAQVNDLAYQFARTPEDVSAATVLVAAWDGQSWQPLPLLSLTGLVADRQQQLIDFREIGPLSGLITTLVGSNYVNSPGVLIDGQGQRTPLDAAFTTPIIGADPDWQRVDRLVFRRPQDSPNRVGVRELVLGGSFATTGPQKLYDAQLVSATLQHPTVQVVVAPDNTVHFFYAEGYGTAFNIRYQKYAANRTSQLVAATTIVAATSQNFSACVDSSGNLHLAFIGTAGVLRWVKLNNVGVAAGAAVTVDAKITPSDFPQIAVDDQGAKVWFLYQNLVAANNNQIFFATLTLTGAVITAPKKVTSTTSNLVHPSLAVTDDLIAFVAYEDSTFGKIYLMQLDDIGTTLVSPVYLSGATGSTSYGTLVDQASHPVVQVADNRQPFVAFLQKKNVSLTGLAVWTNGAAYVANLTSSTESFVAYSMVVDSAFNELHLTVAQSSRLDYVKLAQQTVTLSVSLLGSGAVAASLAKDRAGSLVHAYALAFPGTFTNTSGLQPVSNVGPAAVSGSLNTLVLSNAEFSIPVAMLSYTPKPGDRATISGSVDGNNGAKIVVSAALASINAANDTLIVKVNSPYTAAEVPAVAVKVQFATPDGNTVRFVKTVAEPSPQSALRDGALPTDILLSRISMPGSIILNYIPNGNFGINSDLFGIFGAPVVDWSLTTANHLTMGAGLKILDLVHNVLYTVAAGSFAMSEGMAAYVVLDGITTNISVQLAPVGLLPYGLPIQVLGFIGGGVFNPHLFASAGMDELTPGESVTLGQDMSQQLQARLGVLTDTTYVAYTSTTQFGANDSYPVALSKLDAVVESILTDKAQEETFIVGPGGTNTYTSQGMTWTADNTDFDIVVSINGRKLQQDKLGGLAEDFRKTDATHLQFSFTVKQNTRITVRQERTGGVGGGGGGGGSTDLTNITVSPQPQANGAQGLGTTAKAWSGLYLKDTMTAQVYEITVVNGVLEANPVP